MPHIHQNEDDCKSAAAPSTTTHGVAFYVSLLYSNDNSRQIQLKFIVCIHVLTDATSHVIKMYDVYDV